jgi:hypothetical protein
MFITGIKLEGHATAQMAIGGEIKFENKVRRDQRCHGKLSQNIRVTRLP